ncbi:MAG TPA: hypothetical protein DCL29_07305, partial [Eubacterium sp.]|nr:hypothetical protein [Eubacterium sp.]
MKKNRIGKSLKLREVSKKAICVAASLTLVVSGLAIHKEEAKAAYTVDKYSVRSLTKVDDISDGETCNEINNPGIGFYQGVKMNLTENGDELNEYSKMNLLHFRVDISHFSPYYRQQKGLTSLSSYHINEKALNALRNKLKKARDEHKSVIIRFAYDPKYDSGTSYEPEKIYKDA